MVGAVVVRNGRVIAEGHHRRFGGPHAEVEALNHLKGDLSDATLYVNLEPCCHRGKTPPCTELILRRGVGRVVVGILDPYPEVMGRGVEILRKSGARVETGVHEQACRELNRVFFHWMEQRSPWITLKWAQSLDGRIGTSTGHSQWITSGRSRTMAHRLRAEHDAVMVGVGTLLHDDPRLTVRHVRGRNPRRIVLDSKLRMPHDAKVLDSGTEGSQTWVATTEPIDREKARVLEETGVKIIPCPPDPQGHVDLASLMRHLANAGISSILVEGGARALTSFLRIGLVQRLVCFVAPIILGEGINAVGDLDILRVDDAIDIGSWKVKRLGRELMLDAGPASPARYHS
jgi:diaminohydroxyphosphoribosylaminopyrimidine deaminase/5-amino-6-(5-phosphoribosylamino)uracil reductase